MFSVMRKFKNAKNFKSVIITRTFMPDIFRIRQFSISRLRRRRETESDRIGIKYPSILLLLPSDF